MATLKDLNLSISTARNEAKRQAERMGYKVVRSRGLELHIHVDGMKLEDSVQYPEKMSRKVCTDFLATAHGITEGKVEMYISGGFNGADNPHEMNEGEYDPWVSSWDLEVKEVNGILEEV